MSAVVVSRGDYCAILRTINIAAATKIDAVNKGVKWNEKEEKSAILRPFARLRPSIRQDGIRPPAQTVSWNSVRRFMR
jgi:hypothetical protein